MELMRKKVKCMMGDRGIWFLPERAKAGDNTWGRPQREREKRGYITIINYKWNEKRRKRIMGKEKEGMVGG